jgi:hypothetical protein
MNKQNPALESALIKRLILWAKERFPLSHGLMFLMLYLSAAMLVRQGSDNSFPFQLDMINFLACWSLFLVLRILDEHKDFDIDMENYPERILQSGLVTLSHLGWVAVVAVLFQIVMNMYHDQWFGNAIISWTILIFWLTLMTFEFFAREWLTQRLVLYAFLHMLSMPLIIYWMTQLANPFKDLMLTTNTIMICLIGFFSGSIFEIARKTITPNNERPGVDSYTKIWGVSKTVAVLKILLIIVTILSFTLIGFLDRTLFGLPGILISMALLLISLFYVQISLSQFTSKPHDFSKIPETLPGLYMVVVYGVIIINLF